MKYGGGAVEALQATLAHINVLSISVRLGMALLFGGLIGLERVRKKRPAGFRTYMLVCMGAALTMITNQYVFERWGVSDPVRMGAQVINGIGFLGAGTILVTGRNQVKGLTTAASLWASACMGLAIGIGFYSGAIIGYIYIFIAMTALHKVSSHVTAKSKVINVYVEFLTMSHVSDFFDFAKSKQLQIAEIDIMKPKLKTDTQVITLLTIKADRKMDHVEFLHLLSQAEGVRHIEEI